ncbi:RNA polymerase III transcription factor IIIC subunit-domain-containing protein [Pisolithus sp. B1]|nr:RNA polymerase III transcription factor IIIC subunit-domain-containing protein [Pisolithus sp. B1]
MVTDTRTATAAQERPLPATQFYSVEYPGYVQPSSIHLALRNLGGPSSLENAFKRGAAKNEGLLELNFQPGNPFAHPIPGDIVNTSNILFKVTKRRRRKADGDKSPDAFAGDYTLEAMGIILKSARFRSMADYQFQPDMSDPVAQLRVAMNRMDVDAVRRYTISDEKEDYSLPLGESNRVEIDPQLTDQTLCRSNLRLFPPPLFSRQGIPQNYNFKANPASMVATTADEDTGQERKPTISFGDSNVPQNPSPGLLQARSTIKQDLLDRVVNLLEQRPIWTRAALYNQFNSAEVREIHNSKVILPLACYMFQDGPWRDTLVRFSYDPRKDPAARFYQRVYFRNANHPMSRTSVVTRRQEGRSMEQEETAGIEQRKSHIFDGLTITKETAAFQLCDIVDPMLKEMIEREEDLRETCDERDGWYSAHALERIKTVLRHKFFSLLQGYVATKEECEALLEQSGQKKTQVTRIGKRLKYGKHNMAKGALRPEDAAAARLQATLERNARNLQTTRRVGKHG